jgi:hypothetical protein
MPRDLPDFADKVVLTKGVERTRETWTLGLDPD